MAEDKVYKFLNPVGMQLPVKTFPLAPRLDTLDGKEVWISITGEPDFTIPLERRLKMDYPNVNWRTASAAAERRRTLFFQKEKAR